MSRFAANDAAIESFADCLCSLSICRNWSFRKRAFVGFLIGLLTFAVYIASANYTSSIPGLMEEFGASRTLATAGLTLFVAFYGIGPSESPLALLYPLLCFLWSTT